MLLLFMCGVAAFFPWFFWTRRYWPWFSAGLMAIVALLMCTPLSVAMIYDFKYPDWESACVGGLGLLEVLRGFLGWPGLWIPVAALSVALNYRYECIRRERQTS